MSSISFDEYLRGLFKPASEAAGLKAQLSVSTGQSSSINVDLNTLERWIKEVYHLVDSDLTKGSFTRHTRDSDFDRKLQNIRDKLNFYIQMICSPRMNRENAVQFNKSEKQIFSEFLQHLVVYISDSIGPNAYANKLMERIMINYPSDFFYFRVEAGKKEVSVWVDPFSGDTALIAAAKAADDNRIYLLSEILKEAFDVRESHSTLEFQVSPQFENYLFHENKAGFSALSTVWKRSNPVLINRFLEFGYLLYGKPEKLGFKHFIFQIGEDRSTALMRASDRGDTNLVRLILNSLGNTYDSLNSRGFQEFLQYQDAKGFTTLNRASRQGQYEVVKQLIDKAVLVFEGKENANFQNFLSTVDNDGRSPLISATLGKYKKVIKILFKVAKEAYGSHKQDLLKWMLHQDNDGFTALMHAVEFNQQATIGYFLDSLINISFDIEDSFNILENALKLQTKKGSSLLHIIVRSQSIETLVLILARLHHFFDVTSVEFLDICSIMDNDRMTPLDRIIDEENTFRTQQKAENRVIIPEEEIASAKRAAMAREFSSYDITSPSGRVFPDLRRPSYSRSVQRTGFFSIFCSPFRRLFKRSTEVSGCNFNERDYQSSLPGETSQIRK